MRYKSWLLFLSIPIIGCRGPAGDDEWDVSNGGGGTKVGNALEQVVCTAGVPTQSCVADAVDGVFGDINGGNTTTHGNVCTWTQTKSCTFSAGEASALTEGQVKITGKTKGGENPKCLGDVGRVNYREVEIRIGRHGSQDLSQTICYILPNDTDNGPSVKFETTNAGPAEMEAVFRMIAGGDTSWADQLGKFTIVMGDPIPSVADIQSTCTGDNQAFAVSTIDNKHSHNAMYCPQAHGSLGGTGHARGFGPEVSSVASCTNGESPQNLLPTDTGFSQTAWTCAQDQSSGAAEGFDPNTGVYQALASVPIEHQVVQCKVTNASPVAFVANRAGVLGGLAQKVAAGKDVDTYDPVGRCSINNNFCSTTRNCAGAPGGSCPCAQDGGTCVNQYYYCKTTADCNDNDTLATRGGLPYECFGNGDAAVPINWVGVGAADGNGNNAGRPGGGNPGTFASPTTNVDATTGIAMAKGHRCYPRPRYEGSFVGTSGARILNQVNWADNRPGTYLVTVGSQTYITTKGCSKATSGS